MKLRKNKNMVLASSVTRLLDYLFNIWSFQALRICPKAYKICQSKVKFIANSKCTLSKWPKFLNVVPKWQNVTKSSHTDCQLHKVEVCFKHILNTLFSHCLSSVVLSFLQLPNQIDCLYLYLALN